MKNDLLYDVIAWTWGNTPILKDFCDDTKAIISYLLFQCVLVVGTVWVVTAMT